METYEWNHDAEIHGHALVEGRVNEQDKVLSVLFKSQTTQSEVIEALELLVEPVMYLEFVLPERLTNPGLFEPQNYSDA